MSGLDQNRKRNQTVSFRVSPEERRQLEARIKATGMPKGLYFIESLLHQKIQITAGKYQSDRLGMELKRLHQSLEEGGPLAMEAAQDCKALLEQLMQLMNLTEEFSNER